MSAKLGEILVRDNLVTPQQLREALDYQRVNGGRLGANLVKLGMISDDVITAVLSRQYGVPSINLDLFSIESSVIKLISQDRPQIYGPAYLRAEATLTLAMADPTNVFAMDDIKFMTGLNVEPVIASEASIQMAIGKYYSGDRDRYIRCGNSIRNRKERQPQRQERQRAGQRSSKKQRQRQDLCRRP